MRSPSVLLTFIGCVFVLFPEAALGRTVPYYVYRAPPTSSPTSSPSYQPSASPISLHESYLRTADAKPSSFGLWLIISLTGALLAGVASLLVWKWKKRNASASPPEAEVPPKVPPKEEGGEEDKGGWLPSFWG
jgi:hypothetical protein